MSRIRLDDWERISSCEHGSADWTEWGNLIWSDGRGHCPTCDATLENIEIRTGHVEYDGIEIENVHEDDFCKHCEWYSESHDMCYDCGLCEDCSADILVNRCEGCGEKGEEE